MIQLKLFYYTCKLQDVTSCNLISPSDLLLFNGGKICQQIGRCTVINYKVKKTLGLNVFDSNFDLL